MPEVRGTLLKAGVAQSLMLSAAAAAAAVAAAASTDIAVAQNIGAAACLVLR